MSKATFLALATRPDIMRTALKVSLLVGTVLVAINHGHAIAQGQIDLFRAIQIPLNYLVPYCVSTFSAVRAAQKT